MYAGINASMPTYMHMCFHIPVRISKYTNINAYMILHMRASRHMCQHICIYASIHACIYTYMPAYKELPYACVPAYMHKCFHIYLHICIHSSISAHGLTLAYMLICFTNACMYPHMPFVHICIYAISMFPKFQCSCFPFHHSYPPL